MNSKLKEGIIIGGAFATLFVVGFFHNKAHVDELAEFGKTTEATIVDFKYQSNGRYELIFKYKVDGKPYTDHDRVSFFKCNEPDNRNKGCIGKTFKLVYSSKDPSVFEIDLGKYNWAK